MINIFALILAISTFITGLFWVLERVIHHRRDNIIPIENLICHSGWIKACSSIFPGLLLVFCVRSFIVEPFQIPSGSMMPTLLVGDMILVEKFSYGIKNPITQSMLINIGHPKHGDIVVFKYPLNPSLDYIKRVVGLPGDRVSYDPITKRVTVLQGKNPLTGQEGYDATPIPMTYSSMVPSHFVQMVDFTNNNGHASRHFLKVSPDRQINGGIRLAQRKESLGNHKEYNILMMPGHQDSLESYYRQTGSPLTEWIVPPGEYFMMGDNRDYSADSRYWGFVPERNLVGKATAIWMSFEKKEGKWPTGVRLSRIGSIH